MAYRATEKTRKHKQLVQDRILAAARTVVTEGGFSAVHMSSVAAAAGVATGTLYRHFPSKADLMADVFRKATAHEVQVMSEIATSGGDAGGRLADALETFARRALQAPVLTYALIFEPVDTLVDKERLVFRRSYADVFGNIVDDGIKRGEFPAQNTAIVANCIVGALAEALVGPLTNATTNPSTDSHTDVQAIVSFCLNAVSGTSKGANA